MFAGSLLRIVPHARQHFELLSVRHTTFDRTQPLGGNPPLFAFAAGKGWCRRHLTTGPATCTGSRRLEEDSQSQIGVGWQDRLIHDDTSRFPRLQPAITCH